MSSGFKPQSRAKGVTSPKLPNLLLLYAHTLVNGGNSLWEMRQAQSVGPDVSNTVNHPQARHLADLLRGWQLVHAMTCSIKQFTFVQKLPLCNTA